MAEVLVSAQENINVLLEGIVTVSSIQNPLI